MLTKNLKTKEDIMFQKNMLQNAVNTFTIFVKENKILIAVIFFSFILRLIWLEIPVHGSDGCTWWYVKSWALGWVTKQ